jgi:MFS family permease
MALAMAAPSFVQVSLAAVIVIGLFAGPPAGAIMALPAEFLRPEVRAKGMGIYFTWYYVGMAILPPLAGWLGDATGIISAPLIFASVVMAATMVSLGVFLRIRAN